MTSSFSKIKKVPAYRKLADAIREQILDGKLVEGDQLPTESRLCEMFGVNRSTVREGIRVLEEMGMIRRGSNAKTMLISRPSAEETGIHVERALMLQEITFGELWEAILTIEPMLARLAAGKLDESILAELDENLKKTEIAVKKKSSFLDLDTEFHTLIAKMGANRALNLAREPINNLFNPSYAEYSSKIVPHTTQSLLEAHKAIVKAIRSKNADEAESLMRNHVQELTNGLEFSDTDMNMAIPRVVKVIPPKNKGSSVHASEKERALHKEGP